MKIVDEALNQDSNGPSNQICTANQIHDVSQQRRPYTAPLLMALASINVNGGGTTQIQENSGGLWVS